MRYHSPTCTSSDLHDSVARLASAVFLYEVLNKVIKAAAGHEAAHVLGVFFVRLPAQALVGLRYEI